MSVFQLECLGTKLTIHVESSSSPDEDFRCIRARIVAFEEKYSRFVPGNWLDELNNTGGGDIDEEGYRMLSFALDLAKRTNGAFDPTVGSLLARLGYGHEAERGNATAVGYENVELERYRVTLHNGVRLEFGWVGKGYMLHELSKMLAHHERFLIDFGGDLYAKGAYDIALEDPRDVTKAIGTIRLENGFFCASSGAKRRIGNEMHHLVDPRKWKSSQEVLGAFVEAQDGMVADGYATALCVLGLEDALQLLWSGGIEGAIMAYDGAVFASEKSRIALFGT